MKRLLAATFDVIVVFGPVLIASLLRFESLKYILEHVCFYGWFIYTIGFEFFVGATPGKMLFGLKVAIPNEGRPQIFGKLLLRALIKFLLIIPPLCSIWALKVIWGSDGKSLDDFWVGSRVLRSSDLIPEPPMTGSRAVLFSVLVFILPFAVMFGAMALVFAWQISQDPAWKQVGTFL